MKTIKVLLTIVLIQAMAVPPGAVWAQAPAPAAAASARPIDFERNMILGDLDTIDVKGLTRVSVTSPEIVDISDAQNDQVTLLAKKVGQSAVFLWDSLGKHTYIVNVSRQDLAMVERRVRTLLNAADAEHLVTRADPQEGKVIIMGALSKERRLRVEKILDGYSDQIINLIKEEVPEELVQIDMQITELSSSLDKNLGFDWQPTSIEYAEGGIPSGGSPDWFKFGQFNRTTAIVNTINLLINEGKAKDLSRPRILVTSGKEASINVGGEVPVQSTTTNSTGGQTQSNVTFKQYGVTVTVTPTVKNGKIDVVLNLEVSDVDNSFPIRASTTSDVAYKTRSAQSQLLLEDRQTVVFAGLIRYTESEQTKQVPFLGKIPVLGVLFRNVSKPAPDQGRELVITMTPTIMRKKEYATEQMKMPSKALAQATQELAESHDFESEPIFGAPQPEPVQPPVVIEKAPSVDVSAPGAEASSLPMPELPDMPQAELPATPMNIPASPEISPSKVDATLSPYVRQVQNKISQSITYPYQALQNNWQGTVKLRLTIRKDGTLAKAEVISSSGHDVFDKDALNTAKIAAPFAAFGPDMGAREDLTLTLPIVYSQNTTSKSNAQAIVASY